MTRPGLAVAAAISLFMLPATATKADPRAVLELFTSQGCSSCPPADKLAGELARDRSLVVMSLPIDYWDYLGWKDTLAQPRHTARQRGYAGGRGDREVYTPQVVVNGVAHVVGSDRDAIENTIARSNGREGSLTVPVNVAVDADEITINIAPPKDAEAVADVWLVGIASALAVAIKRGENRGRTLTYHNVARRWIKVGTWTGGKQRWTVPKSELKTDGLDHLTVLVQAGGNDKPGALLGAGMAPLR